MPKDNKLPFAEFQTARSKVLRASGFTLKYKDNKIGRNRFGIIVSSRVSKKAVIRNLWKRRFRELSKNFPNYGEDFLFVVSPSIVNLNFHVLKKELEKARRKIKQP